MSVVLGRWSGLEQEIVLMADVGHDTRGCPGVMAVIDDIC